ncbi:MAG: coenzyme F420-0:L-glutamate ligase [Promethearchaeota archaeon]
MKKIEIIGLQTIPFIELGDNLAEIIFNALNREKITLENGDIFLIAQTVVSKSTGMIKDLREIKPSKKALEIYEKIVPKMQAKGIPEKSPELIEYILRESKKILKSEHVLITETKHGFVCANAGIDKSNVRGETKITLLPKNPDKEAEKIRAFLEKKTYKKIGVIIIDSFGRPFRNGSVGVAIGISGIDPLLDKRGHVDLFGHQLQSTIIAQADNLASAAQLMMGESNEGIPVVLIRGYDFEWKKQSNIGSLLRKEKEDLFRINEPSRDIEKCIETARWAPNAHNAQPWRYIILEQGEIRNQLINKMNEKLKKDLEKEGKSKEFINDKINKTRMNFLDAPCLILPCLDKEDLDLSPDDERNQNEFIMGIQSVSNSITYFLLALHANDLAACWYCAPLFAQEVIKETLALPKSYIPLAFITVGYPKKEIKAPSRKEINDILFYSEYFRKN